ncbi:MAG: Ldh family oxidoreductase, partial [Bradyrhizobium sp.]
VTAQVLAFALLIGAIAIPGAFLEKAFVERMPVHILSAILVVDVMIGGALTGTGATSGGRRFANGMLAFYVDPKVVDTSHVFDAEVSRYTDFIRATKPTAGVDQVLIPGDPERKTRAERTKNGIPLPDDTWAAIVNTAREVGVSEVSIQRATA